MIDKREALQVVATNVNRLLSERGWSVRELARRSENTPMLVSRLTRQENMPAGDVLKRIAEAFEIAIDDLFLPSNPPKSGRSKISA